PVFRAKLMALHQQGVPLTTLSTEFGVAREVLGRWWARYQAGDLAALTPTSRRPLHSPTRTARAMERRVLRLRTQRLSAVRIAHALGLGHSTVQRLLERHGANQLPRPARATPRRYEKQRPGELLHLDLKNLPALRTHQTSPAAAAFLEHVVSTLPYRIEAVLTDNAFAFTMRHALHAERLTRFQQVCAALDIRHHVLRPYAPQSNGKVERFFRTINDECLHVRPLFTFPRRSRAVEEFVWYYNHERPHLSLGGMTPVDRRKLYFRQAQ